MTARPAILAGLAVLFASGCYMDRMTNNYDIASTSDVFERRAKPQKIADTDIGVELQTRIDDLKLLLRAFRDGVVTEDHR